MFLALGGSAYAVKRIDGKDIAAHTIPAGKLKKETLTREEIGPRAIGRSELSRSLRAALRDAGDPLEPVPGQDGYDGLPGEPGEPGEPGPPGGACDYSFIFENGEYESTPAATSPLADKYGCQARKEEAEVVDPKQGYVWDSTRQDPGADGWGHYPRSGRAQVFVFPGCKDGRVVADVVRLKKGHTEGLEPNVTDKLIALAVSARGGKIRSGAWTPPPPPQPGRGPFGL